MENKKQIISGTRVIVTIRFLLLLAIVACFSPLWTADAALTHYYNMDETSGTTAHDSYGGQNATLVGATFDARSVSGVIGNALNFTNNVYLSVPPAALQFGTNSFSINLWARRDLTSAFTAFIHLQNTASGNPGAFFARISASSASPPNAVTFTVDKGATADTVYSTNKITADAIFHMFSFVRESGSALRIYVDGVLVGSTTDTAFNINGTVAIIGANTSGTVASSFFVGPIDDVRIFDNVLSDADIQSLFTSRQPAPAIDPLVVTQNPISQTNVLGDTVILTGAFTNNPFAYQWYKDGSPVAGADKPTLILPAVTFDDAGNYFLSATNGAGFTNTATATLTVLFSQVGVQSAQSLLTLQHVRVAYNQQVTDSAIDIGSYSFQNNALVISNVYRTSPTTVEIVTSPQVPGSNYVLQINNVSGSSGSATNTIAPGTQVSVTAPALVACVGYDAGTPVSQPSGPPDPVSATGGYWQYLPSTNVNLTVSSITDDGGLNAWEIQDYSSASGGIGYQMPVPLESQDFARTNGWRYQVRCRMVNNNFASTASVGLVYSDVGLHKRFFIALNYDNNNNLTAQIFTDTGSVTNTVTTDGSGTSYHTHCIIYDPASSTATYYLDNKPIFANWTGSGGGSVTGPFFGAATSVGQGDIAVNQVQFDVVHGTQPSVLTALTNATRFVGDSVTLTPGFSPFVGSYLWFSNDVVIPDARSTNYTVGPLTPEMSGTEYKCLALHASGNVETASILTVVAALTSPSGLSATPDNAKVVLNWAASDGAASYNVKRATVSGGPYTTIFNSSITNYEDIGVTNGTTYYYVVSAVNAGGESSNSAEVSATPLGSAMSVVYSQGNIIINFAGTLQSATNVAGPYLDVPGNPPSPYTIIPNNQLPQEFFRVRTP